MANERRTAGRSQSLREFAHAVLKLEHLALVLPRSDVRTLEAAADLEAADPPPNGVGWIEAERGRFPVYCFSPELEPLARPPAGRRICVVLDAGGEIFGFLASEVVLLEKSEQPVHTVPRAMAAPGSPVLGVTVYADAVACVSSARAILSHARLSLEAA